MKTLILQVLVAGLMTAVVLMMFGHSLDRLGLVSSGVDPQNDVYVKILIRNDICPDSKRFGRGNEGGWFVCDSKTLELANPCIVYSFGIKDDFSFDQAMHDMGCKVHGFDPSPYGLASKSLYEAIGGEYHAYGLGVSDAEVQVAPFRWPGIGYLRNRNTDPWVLKRIPTIMKELGHLSMTYLKVDVEGSEWDAIDNIIAANWGEFAVEMHFPPKEYLIDIQTDGIVYIARNGVPFEEPAVPTWLNRIALVKKLLAVADVWKVEPNAKDKQCMNVYFKMR